MKKPQWVTLSIAVLLVIGLFAATQGSLFGERKGNKAPSAPVAATAESHDHGLSTDSILYHAKQNLPQAQVARLAFLENSIVRGDVAEQKLHLMHQLAKYWSDSARAFTPMAWYPYAYYTGEAARLENSEKSLSFAAHLFLAALAREEAHQLKDWEADQAKDLFERSLKLNPQNDSAKVGLGATILYSGHGAPMTGIAMIREVAERDPKNVFAQLTLGEASLISGQLDKAVERFKTVVQLHPENLQAAVLLADTYERMNKKDEAVKAYKKALPHISIPEMKKEVEKRINDLNNK
ncbi:MAG: tetratricopeptide repeat protein [Chitinophagaceae bacterium]|nr:MAG: tetratricopeptide repeat protein [Chitinophagaceae bacterium]